MKLRLFAAVVALALTTVAAHAQIGIYLNPIATRVSLSTPDTGPFAFLGPNSKSQMFYGVNVGGYYDLYHQGKIEAGIDVRDTYQRGNNAKLNSFLVGARVCAAPFVRPIKPFLQASVGVGTTTPPTNPSHVSKVEFGLFGGVDYTLARHIDFRVVEVGYSSLQTASNSTIGGTATVPSASLISISTGLVFRFR